MTATGFGSCRVCGSLYHKSADCDTKLARPARIDELACERGEAHPAAPPDAQPCGYRFKDGTTCTDPKGTHDHHYDPPASEPEEIALHRALTGGRGFIPDIDGLWEQCPGKDWHSTCGDHTYEHATFRRVK